MISSHFGIWVPKWSIFPVRAPAQGSLCPVGPLGPPPGLGLYRVGGLKCRKNAAFLKDRVKNTYVLVLWLLEGLLGGAGFMRIYGVPAHFAYIG